MNRIDEYNELLNQLEKIPAQLDSTIQSAINKGGKARRIRRFVIMPLSSATLFFVTFVIMVNVSATFAIACGKIPIISELAKAVAFSPSLATAVENDYVQLINLEQTQNEITMRVEYVIVDQKQLNIFYTLNSEVYFKMSSSPQIKSIIGEPLEGYKLSTGVSDVPNGEMRQITADFVDVDMPNGLVLNCNVHDNGGNTQIKPVNEAPAPTSAPGDFLTKEVFEQPQYIAEFSFALNFDQNFTTQGENITLNKEFILDGQKLVLTSAEIYPSHIRINLNDDETNTAWLQSLSFYIENENGEKFESIKNGVSATGKENSKMMAAYRLESSFFSESKSLTLYITDVVWLEKENNKAFVNLANKKTENMPEGVALEAAERNGNNWILTFTAKYKEKGMMYQLFESKYYDEAENVYEYKSSSSMSDDNKEVFRHMFALTNYPHDTVYLQLSYTSTVRLSEPVEIKIK